MLFGLDRRAEEQRARLGVNHDHALPKLQWWAEHEPERLARAATAVDAAGFVVAGLCGELVMDAITAEAYQRASRRRCRCRLRAIRWRAPAGSSRARQPRSAWPPARR